MQIDLTGKRAVVTGSTAGIGLAIATGLAQAGAEVVVNGRTEERVQNAIATIRMAAPAAILSGIASDLGTAEGAAKLAAGAAEADILVNSVGAALFKSFDDLTDEDWLFMYQLNVLSGVRLTKHYLPGMVERGWGRIVFISSESALNPPKEMIDYGMTKAAQLAVARGVAELAARTGVTVNSVLPGPTRSEGFGAVLEGIARQTGQSIEQVEKGFLEQNRPTSLLGRFSTTEEIANMVVYVCSQQASATNGSALRVDGGVVRSIT
ncbi:NAD(P)-dependent dehydrogenase (short-subunit alcohol dehydrogenase family) [Azospirillum lipoferum]|uniref:SDR family oxidoreductase n=1 Tax=Azospirillum lipoferum TaxID=193 RepID=A0A5A9GNE5_AZOLI|nr:MULTISPECIES: SDR family oxidoreductase [Azospirillum]KAA0595951.1 SDR family oxidoreductase [Azospirillum lipoferum]MCP1610843.1 NAD(P)-dependent dehydrogenase (short-subunit alcohol dehydrogenase family) [Azospirillum lipoferum]MDW5534007.1 SDR family oxidoreductase [Azospirillum sp. NL1]